MGHYKVQMLQAGYGDCLFVTLDQGTPSEFNILIDGGLRSCYTNLRHRPMSNGPLKNLIETLKTQTRKIDLLIITHVDDDHIGGIKYWFEDDFPNQEFVSEIWFNDDVVINESQSLQNSPASAASLLSLLREKNRSFCNYVVSGMHLERNGYLFNILSPKPKYRNIVSKKIEGILQNSSKENEGYKYTLSSLYAHPYANKSSLSYENRASIAFEIVAPDGEKALFLGDASIKDILEEFENIYPKELWPVNYSMIKLSHHGSSYNFTPSFLDHVHAQEFLVSTDGNNPGHPLPDKEVLAHILNATNSCVCFNYREVVSNIFLPQDYEDMPHLVEKIKCTSDDES